MKSLLIGILKLTMSGKEYNSGGIGSGIVNEKVTDSTATDKVYSAAYVNVLEARLKILEEALTIGKISEIGGR